MDPVIREFLAAGVVGAVAVGLILGILVPKYVMDESRKREAAKDAIIEKLTDALQRLADKAEARYSARKDDASD